MKIRSFLFAAVISLSSLAGITAVANVGLPISDPREFIVVTQEHPEFSIKLHNNQGTGYGWYLVDNYNHHLIKPTSFAMQVPVGEMPGAARFDQFHFRLSKAAFKVPVELTLTFALIRPWQSVQAMAGGKGVTDKSNCDTNLQQTFRILVRPDAPEKKTFVKR